MKDKEFTDEEINELLNQYNSYIKKDSKLRLLKSLLNSLMVLMTFLVAILTLVLVFKNQNLSLGDKYFNKSIKSDIQKTIKSNASLDVVKNIYTNRKEYSPSLTDLFNKSSDKDKYLAETPLSEVLNDMKTDYYLSEKQDTIYLKKLVSIIDAHEIINPFDKLEENQKNDFENLRFKLGENYSSVLTDVNRITDELHNKNQLVVKYLDKSNISFLISIVALIITILLSFYQIYQNRKERLLAILGEVISSRNKENKEEKEK
ncbi:hypothetical protein ED312_09280 [Sinomicrobium pectinilyticum]|uniref:Uncharacterized protein n=1 Tax=Sinomicrobium pectinilyticum TaxID=1084421 RepID=A0A3N0EJM0_SINP1|nr:hypothetical protein [Sinomicrobium pectinilyticum]RNL88100.1 hypothetical protein ED312_09280 [Sinomicrobium pectinilyticum]